MSSARPITETPPAPPGGEVAPAPARRVLPWPPLNVEWPQLSRRYAYRLLAFAPVGLLALLAWSRRWTSEDAFIYYRVVDQLLAGHGPVFNVGERVEAYTGPLWLAVLAVARAVAPAGVELEWVSVALGLALSAGGLLAAVLAARRLWSPASSATAGHRALMLPLGALVVAALPPFWDFATSGLETGLVFAWLGGTFLGLVAVGVPARGEATRSPRARYGLAVAIGLGPLVRPDLTIFAAAFLIVLAMLERPFSPWRALRLAGAAAAIPLVYQLFRMGYFGSLVPNTALAKEAGAVYWSRGFAYLVDLFAPYALWLPVAVLLAWAAVGVRTLWSRAERDRALLVVVAVAAGVVHALYIVRLGGDYMHARMLLPSVFAMLMPVAVVAARRGWTVLLAAVVVPWAVVCASSLRAPAEPAEEPTTLQVNDQRRRYAELWGYRDPVTLDHFAAAAGRRPGLYVRQGRDLAALAESTRAVVVTFTSDRNRFGERSRRPIPLKGVAPRPEVRSPVVVRVGSIGRVGFAAGPRVQVVDRNGVADPMAARVRLPPQRPSRPGHEKTLPEEWVLARFVVATSEAGRRRLAEPGVRTARRALACPPLRELSAATTAPMGAGRFLANVAYAVREPSLRFAPEPPVAVRELCERR